MSNDQKKWWETALQLLLTLEITDSPAVVEALREYYANTQGLRDEGLTQVDVETLKADMAIAVVKMPLQWQWVAALQAVDERGDNQPLLELLKTWVPPELFPDLEDLFDRRKLVLKRKGKPRVPSYMRGHGPELALRQGVERVRRRIGGGMSPKDALAEVAEQLKIPPRVLTNAYQGRRGASRPRKKTSAS